jgi:hypothetical protein
MRRRLVSLLTVAAVAPVAVLAGCGDDEEASGGLDLAKTASATAGKGTAKMRMTIKAEGTGLPVPLNFTAEGVTALDRPRLDMTLDLSSLSALAGGGQQDLKTRIVVEGRDVRIKVPKLDALPPIPGGKQWVKIDAKKAAEALGIDADGLGKVFTIDPAGQLKALRAAKGMQEVGKEEIAGASTTHYRGTFKASDFIKGLPAADRKAAEEAFKALEDVPGGREALDQAIPTEMWIDDEGVVRRMRQSQQLPAAGGTQGGKFDVTYELRDFGAAFPGGRPADDEVFDATEALTGLLRQGAAAGAGAQQG